MLPINPLLNATAPAGPHLPAATLRQYAAGTLPPAARHRVEAHTLACPRCADILDGLLQTAPATTDQALAQLQQRLRRRVQQLAPAPRTRHQHRWLIPQLATAAALLFGLLAGGWWTWQQRHAAVAPPVATVARPPAPPAALAATPAPAAPVALAVPVAPQPPHPRRSAPVAVARARRPQRVAADTTAAAPVAATSSTMVAAASTSPPPAPSEVQATPETDSASAAPLSGRVAGLALAAPARKLPAQASALVRDRAMPAAPPVPPTPAVGYAGWREKIRREAAEFHPEVGEPPLSGSVQLRLLIGADGKIQEVRLLHGLREDYDEEAQRLICDGPGWIPGIGGGKRATQAVDVTVPFQ